MHRMTLNELIEALTDLREDNPHLADMEVYSELKGGLGASSVLGVEFDDEGVTLRITTDHA